MYVIVLLVQGQSMNPNQGYMSLGIDEYNKSYRSSVLQANLILCHPTMFSVSTDREREYIL